ncbi:MAG: preprotein translocase subunit SecE [Polyangiaceae bacterium]|nr:preprotein translocase subunit SecE [Polyangiaceae bacterium]
MTTKEDLEKAEGAEEAESLEASVRAASREEDEVLDKVAPEEAYGAEVESAPLQFGYQRFVYAAYMAGAMAVAFLVAKIGHVSWYRLGQWKPDFGEPKDEIVYSVAGLIGVLVAVHYWRKPSARQYTTEVAEELSKVTWPTRKEVWNSTTVVILTTLFATVFFALMDQFWKFVTDKIYSF